VLSGHHNLQGRAGNEPNRLRSTMLDDWLSALTVMSAEKDLLKSLAIHDFINRFARCSSALQKQLFLYLNCFEQFSNSIQ